MNKKLKTIVLAKNVVFGFVGHFVGVMWVEMWMEEMGAEIP